MKKHSFIITLVAIIFAINVIIAFKSGSESNAQTQTSTGKADIGGNFTLTDSTGKTVTNQDFAGRYMLVYFGFTHCPDMCPTALTAMTNALNELGGKAKRITPIFVTTDPERDTVKAMAEYKKSFHPSLVALTGKEADIKKLVADYKGFYQKEGKGKDYQVNHSGFMYLMDPKGEYVTHYGPDTTADALKADLNKRVAE